MRRFYFNSIFLLFLVSVFTFTVSAEDTDLPSAGSKGVYLSVFGDSSPSLFGFSGYYYLTRFLRGTASLGIVAASVGLKSVVPGWSLTPVLGMNGSYSSLGGQWTGSVYGNFGIQLFGPNLHSLEAGVNCDSKLLKGDWGACTSYLNIGYSIL